MSDQPNEQQLQAIKNFRAKHGRNWKSALSQCWLKASYPGMGTFDSACLQQLRNEFGPSWLKRYRAG